MINEQTGVTNQIKCIFKKCPGGTISYRPGF